MEKGHDTQGCGKRSFLLPLISGVAFLLVVAAVGAALVFALRHAPAVATIPSIASDPGQFGRLLQVGAIGIGAVMLLPLTALFLMLLMALFLVFLLPLFFLLRCGCRLPKGGFVSLCKIFCQLAGLVSLLPQLSQALRTAADALDHAASTVRGIGSGLHQAGGAIRGAATLIKDVPIPRTTLPTDPFPWSWLGNPPGAPQLWVLTDQTLQEQKPFDGPDSVQTKLQDSAGKLDEAGDKCARDDASPTLETYLRQIAAALRALADALGGIQP